MLFVTAMTSGAAGTAYGAATEAQIDVTPFVYDGRVYCAIRPFAEAFGIGVRWDQANQQVTLARGVFRAVLKIGSAEMALSKSGNEETTLIAVSPILREGRACLPVHLWAEFFGILFSPQADGVFAVLKEGEKVLTFSTGSQDVRITGGHFLTVYNRDKSFLFAYPVSGTLGAVWDGYAEVLLHIDGEDYVITAVNAGAGLSDPIHYTMEEIDDMLHRNADGDTISVQRLPESLYGVPAFRFSSCVAGNAQTGVLFLKDGVLCGLTVETKREPGTDVFQSREVEIVLEDDLPGAATDAANESAEAEVLPTADTEESDRIRIQAQLAVAEALLDEIMPSFVVW